MYAGLIVKTRLNVQLRGCWLYRAAAGRCTCCRCIDWERSRWKDRSSYC